MKSVQLSFTSLIVIFLCSFSDVKAQIPDLNPDFWHTFPQRTNAITEDSANNVVYYGGIGFNNKVYPNRPYGIAFDRESGAPLLNVKAPNAEVKAAASDGSGGWFIGGEFTEVGGEPRKHLARFDAEGNLTDWNPGANGTVDVLRVFENRLYVGGDFTALGGKSRLKVACFDLASGALTDWSPNLIGQHVNDIAEGNGTAYIGGVLSRVNIAGLNGGAVDAETGEGIGYFAFPNGKVTCSASDGNGGFFIGGLFTAVAGIERHNIAHVNADGHVSDWNPGVDGEVKSLKLQESMLLIGGNFTQVAGALRQNAAAVNPTTGALLPWNPRFAGEVLSIDIAEEKIYVGGDYTATGEWAKNGGAVDATTGDLNFSEQVPDGTVRAAVSDGNGGWFIGGDFMKVGNTPRERIAHIDAAGELTDWYPGPINATVRCINLLGNRLFVSGDFNTVGGNPRQRLAAIDAHSGDVLPWNTFPNGPIRALLAHEGVLYLGGGFVTMGEVSRLRLAALNPLTGEVLPLSITPSFSNIHALAAKGDTLFFGGTFTQVNGEQRNRLACINRTTGTLLDWNPNANNTVSAMAILDNTIYVGGTFTNVAGLSRIRVAAIEVTTGNATSWAPSNQVSTTENLAVVENAVYAAGRFERPDGSVQNVVAALDPITGTVLDWDPNITSAPFLEALATDGNSVYLGGNMPSFGGEARRSASAFDLATGELLDWDPVIGGSPVALQAIHARAGKVFMGGLFSSVGGQTKISFAAVDINTAEVSPWNLNLNGAGQVRAITGQDNTVYVGGSFNSVGGQSRNRLAAVDASSGAVSAFTANIVTGDVRALDLHEEALYLGGSFINIAGVTRPRAAAVNTSSGALLPWNPGMNGLLPLTTIERADNKVFMGGLSGVSWGGTTTSNVVAVDAVDGVAEPFNVNLSGEVFSLLSEDSTLYVGGSFGEVNGTSRSNFAAINTQTQELTPLNPVFNSSVRSIASFNENLWIGGFFTSVNGNNRRSLAVISKGSGLVNPGTPSIAGGFLGTSVNDIVIGDGTAYLTGVFSGAGGISSPYLVSFNALTGSVINWDANIDGSGNALAVSDSAVFVGGEFIRAGLQPTEGLIALSTADGLPTGFEISVSGEINALKVHNNMLYIAGSFNQIDGQPRTNLAAIDLSTGDLSDWAPQGNEMTTGLEAFGNRIFTASASFLSDPPYAFAAFDSETGALDPFNPDPDGGILSILVAEGKLYVGGFFSEISGETRSNLVAYDASSLELLPFNPAPNGGVSSMSFMNQTLYMSGSFTQIAGQNRGNLAALDTETELALEWNVATPSLSAVSQVVAWKDQLILAGLFTEINGTPRFRLASVSLEDGSLSDWNPNPQSFANNIGTPVPNPVASSERLYIMGRFDTLEGEVTGSPAVYGALSETCAITPLCQSFTLTLENDEPVILNPEVIDAGSTAACGFASISVSPDVFGPDDAGENTVTLTVTDTEGNSATCEAIVTVTTGDTLTLECPDDVEQSCAESTLPEVTGTATAVSPCGIESLTYTDSTAFETCSAVIVRTWTAADLCGNTISCEQIITQLFDEAPELIMPVQTSTGLTCSILSPDELNLFLDGQMNGPDADAYTAYLEQLFETYGLVPPGAMSECSEAEVVLTGFSPGAEVSCPVKAAVQAEWAAVDACGNQSDVLITAISVSDLSTPVIFGAPDVVIGCEDPTTPDFTGFSTASDNCDEDVLLTYSDALLGSGCGASFIRVWTASDQCGNTATYEQFITLAEEPVSCTTPPTGLAAQPLGEGEVELSWSPVPGTVACRVFGRLAGSSGSVAAGTVTGNEPSSIAVTNSALKDGRQIEWRVICACSTQPLVTTPYSAWSNFTFYAPQGSASISVPSGDGMTATLNVWPNPTNGMATVTFNASISGDAGLELFDIHGRSVEKLFGGYVESGSEHILSLDGNRLSSGVYLCRLTTAAGVEMRRLIVSR